MIKRLVKTTLLISLSSTALLLSMRLREDQTIRNSPERHSAHHLTPRTAVVDRELLQKNAQETRNLHTEFWVETLTARN